MDPAFSAFERGAYWLAGFYILTAVFNLFVSDPSKWEGEVEARWPGFKKLADFMRKSGIDPIATWSSFWSLLSHILQAVAKAGKVLPVAVVAGVTMLGAVSGCAALESFFTPNRIAELGELGACVVPMVESGRPLGDIIAVCGPDAEKFVAGYKAGLKRYGHPSK